MTLLDGTWIKRNSTVQTGIERNTVCGSGWDLHVLTSRYICICIRVSVYPCICICVDISVYLVNRSLQQREAQKRLIDIGGIWKGGDNDVTAASGRAADLYTRSTEQKRCQHDGAPVWLERDRATVAQQKERASMAACHFHSGWNNTEISSPFTWQGDVAGPGHTERQRERVREKEKGQ